MGALLLSLCECGAPTDLAAWLDALPPDGLGASGHTNLVCPACRASVEVVLGNGTVSLGYSYAAGETHFEPTRQVQVPGLRVVAGVPDDLGVWLAERHWQFGVTLASHLRFAVLPNAWARGRRLGDLEFRAMSVEVEALERAGAKAAPDLGQVLAVGDFLWLAGPQPALTRAWLRMNHGPR